MTIMGARSRTVVCVQNVSIADFLCAKREEFRTEKPSKLLKTMDNACNGICDHPTPIRNLYDAKQVRNVGPWILKMLKTFFEGADIRCSPGELSAQEQQGRNGQRKRRYCPRVRTAAYALLITLLRGHQSGKFFMTKQELIDATDLSGLSDKPIRPNPVGWNGGQPKNMRDLYSGWNGMKTLTDKCLVVKSSNPGKYKLTSEGVLVARECLGRSGLQSGSSSQPDPGRTGVLAESESEDLNSERDASSDSDAERQEAHTSPWRQSDTSFLDSASVQQTLPKSTHTRKPNGEAPPIRPASMPISRNNFSQNHSPVLECEDPANELAVPPLDAGEKFSDAYNITCVVDLREKFRSRASAQHTYLELFAESLQSQFNIKVDKRMLPVGDTLWVAQHKRNNEEYVLDFVVERKQVDDLWQSIKDNRYKQQKLRLLNCGLKRLIYLVEGDVNTIESTDSLKTAMFSTQMQGFHLLRTIDSHHTCKQYGHLTLSIINRYNMEVGKSDASGPVCKTYSNFMQHCKEMEKGRVSDVFCLQLTQISHVTEDVALTIKDRYPTLFSLVQAYANLEGNTDAQKKLLQGIPIRNSMKTISAGISKNVFKLVWAQ